MGHRTMILVKKNGVWYDTITNAPFTGNASVNGKTYNYTADGKKILLTKPAPDISKFVRSLWERENPLNKGFVNGKYHYYKTDNGNWDIGPGIDRSKQTKAFNQRAEQGFTRSEMNAEVTRRAKDTFQKVDEALKTVTQFPDTISPQIKEGLADLRYQTGPLVSNFPNLLKAVAHGDTKGMANESKVYFTDAHGNKKFDARRYNTRMKENFHYQGGGSLVPNCNLIDSIANFKARKNNRLNNK